MASHQQAQDDHKWSRNTRYRHEKYIGVSTKPFEEFSHQQASSGGLE